MAFVNQPRDNLKLQVYVAGLSPDTDDRSLREAFRCFYGEAVEAQVCIDPKTDLRFGLVTLTSSEAAAAAISSMDGRHLHGRMLKVEYCRYPSKIIPLIRAFRTKEWKPHQPCGRGYLPPQEIKCTRALNTDREQGEEGCTISIDIQRDAILSRIPASSLIRLRSACKLWHDSTYDPSFIDLQLEHARRRRPKSGSRLIILSKSKFGIDGEITLMDEAVAPKISFPITCTKSISISSSCNGLVCLHGDSESVLLFNPTTRERLYLPPAYAGKRGVCPPRCCLGFLPSTKEYKVVRFAHRRRNSYRCEVFTLGTSSWRRICDIDLQPIGLRGVTVDGMMYWTQLDSYMILAFDLKDEKLMSIRIPNPPNFEYIELFEAEGSLCLMGSRSYIYRQSSMEIWMLKDANKNIWIRRYPAAGQPQRLTAAGQPQRLTAAGQLERLRNSYICYPTATPVLLHEGKLLIELCGGGLYQIDLEAQSLSMEMVYRVEERQSICDVGVYEESLVSLERWYKS